jgi:hypothetical protein
MLKASEGASHHGPGISVPHVQRLTGRREARRGHEAPDDTGGVERVERPLHYARRVVSRRRLRAKRRLRPERRLHARRRLVA